MNPKAINLDPSASSPNLSLPDRNLLGLHAVCARVAHMSGAAEYIDQIQDELEDIMVLAQDGSSAKYLDHCLTMVSKSAYVS